MENIVLREENAIADQRKEKLISIYKAYNVIDWIIVIVIIGAPIAVGVLEGLGFPGVSIHAFMAYINSLPPMVIIPVALASTAYTVWTVILYVKVWPIKEVPKGFTYWLDWFLTFVLIVYEALIFYTLLVG
ncbi:MAG: hypothetical protein FWC32_05020 [Firmicutes bacterium]|nr:hypothetical protein [Bacillota bacterium]